MLGFGGLGFRASGLELLFRLEGLEGAPKQGGPAIRTLGSFMGPISGFRG